MPVWLCGGGGGGGPGALHIPSQSGVVYVPNTPMSRQPGGPGGPQPYLRKGGGGFLQLGSASHFAFVANFPEEENAQTPWWHAHLVDGGGGAGAGPPVEIHTMSVVCSEVTLI